ncbi:hypothetical protein O6H91_21G023200 [Diphasiastrum complanatum]|uniref:Uncharacterized protein n=2 Tax=Diphasiastrum complanatum TaxID=34168 RepID=A0ACC2AIU1_DIPCM|nr:hypothetical protein O6H91_21G007500 [Diphasiastrum complanatum]KAJ7517411.1 hypothetical protein O6H91_21G023200 [Diphasiastrum complanatum]
MFGCKRLAPCGGFSDNLGKMGNDSTLSVYEKTLDKLMEGARNTTFNRKEQTPFRDEASQYHPSLMQNGSSQTTLREMGILESARSHFTAAVSDKQLAQQTGGNSCVVCSFNRNATSKCSHCMKSICNSCYRMCDGCEEAYCTLCTISNFEERYDRVFCFDCNSKDLKQRC